MYGVKTFPRPTHLPAQARRSFLFLVPLVAPPAAIHHIPRPSRWQRNFGHRQRHYVDPEEEQERPAGLVLLDRLDPLGRPDRLDRKGRPGKTE